MSDRIKDVTHWTYSEFIDFAEDDNNKKSKPRHSDRRGYMDSWAGSGSLKEAVALAREGWDAGIEQMDLEDGLLVAGSGSEFLPAIAGQMVNVPAYINGLPESMFALADNHDYNRPRLTVIVNLAYSAMVGGETAMSFSKALVAMVNSLQAKYAIRIKGFFGQQGVAIKTDSLQTVVIKEFDEPMVLNSIAFSFHPSFFRRIHFAHSEKFKMLDWGYGIPMQKHTTVFKAFGERALIEQDDENYMISLGLNELQWKDLNVKGIIETAAFQSPELKEEIKSVVS